MSGSMLKKGDFLGHLLFVTAIFFIQPISKSPNVTVFPKLEGLKSLSADHFGNPGFFEK